MVHSYSCLNFFHGVGSVSLGSLNNLVGVCFSRAFPFCIYCHNVFLAYNTYSAEIKASVLILSFE